MRSSPPSLGIKNKSEIAGTLFIYPWTVMMTYRRSRNPIWTEFVCAEGNNHVVIGTETYFLSPDRNLMPTRKDQPPPDLRYFNPPPK